MSQLLFGNKFGSVEKLAAVRTLLIFLRFFSYFSGFHKYSKIFKLDHLHIVP